MNKQIIYDVILFGLRKQGKPSVYLNRNCVYRDNTGNRCAIGMWINNESYDERMEGRSVKELISSALKDGFKIPHWFGEHEAFLSSMQCIHDGPLGLLPSSEWHKYEKASWLPMWEASMQHYANHNYLIYTPPGQEPEDAPTVESVARQEDLLYV